ncbi:MAG: DUF3179 domain-containing (seleno)protein [Calditrichia bacterium]
MKFSNKSITGTVKYTVFYRIFCFLLFPTLLLLQSCSQDPASTSEDITINRVGYGVSGILFENNLVMWYRENSGERTELFSQMYMTRLDEADFPVWTDFPDEFLVSGGVPRDGIPALVNPTFVTANAAGASYLKSIDLVLGVEINGEVKAYPHNILWWHEVVNDQVGGKDIIMTFCPLTGSGVLFEKPVNGDSVGAFTPLPVIETTWSNWQSLYPETKVIAENTGIDRNYTRYPYGDYRAEDSFPLFSLRTGSIDERFPPKRMVLGLVGETGQKAYPFSSLDSSAVVNDEFDGKNVLILSDIDERMAQPYSRDLNGQTLTFTQTGTAPFQMTDAQTGSTWNIIGEATAGSLQGQRLEPIAAYNAFWFAWAAFWPDTEVYE